MSELKIKIKWFIATGKEFPLVYERRVTQGTWTGLKNAKNLKKYYESPSGTLSNVMLIGMVTTSKSNVTPTLYYKIIYSR